MLAPNPSQHLESENPIPGNPLYRFNLPESRSSWRSGDYVAPLSVPTSSQCGRGPQLELMPPASVSGSGNLPRAHASGNSRRRGRGRRPHSNRRSHAGRCRRRRYRATKRSGTPDGCRFPSRQWAAAPHPRAVPRRCSELPRAQETAIRAGCTGPAPTRAPPRSRPSARAAPASPRSADHTRRNRADGRRDRGCAALWYGVMTDRTTSSTEPARASANAANPAACATGSIPAPNTIGS